MASEKPGWASTPTPPFICSSIVATFAALFLMMAESCRDNFHPAIRYGVCGYWSSKFIDSCPTYSCGSKPPIIHLTGVSFIQNDGPINHRIMVAKFLTRPHFSKDHAIYISPYSGMYSRTFEKYRLYMVAVGDDQHHLTSNTLTLLHGWR